MKAKHYDVATGALLWAFGAALESDFYPEVNAAWRTALEMIIGATQDGAAELQRA